MRISNITAAIGTKYTSLNSNVANKSMNQNSSTNCDTLSISNSAKNAFSKQSQMSSMLDSLLKQKQNIIDAKNSLIERTTEKEESLSSIKDQLSEFEDQINTIDSQISSYMLEEKGKALGTDKKNDTEADNKPKTEREAQDAQLNNIVSLDTNILQIQVGSSIKDKLEGQSRVLVNEIKLDEARSITGQKATSKREQLTEINANIDNISKNISKAFVDTKEKIEDNLESENTDTFKNPQELSIASLDDKEKNPYINNDIL